MKTVLHLSDLHLKNDDYPKEKLESLIQIIKNKKIDILVITGDLKNWDATFENSIKFINTLVDNIGIENVVIVPGNHDVKCIESASLCYNKTNGECNLLDNKINSVELQKQTEDFFDACKKINNCRTSQEIQTIRLYNFNFIIANSVVGYDNKKNNPFCCNCEKLYNHIQENITKYFEADTINVFVTHTNDESLCESSLHDYKGSSIISELNKICHIKLFGHLHVREKRNKDSLLEFCVGNDSFYSETLNYNLYNFTENSVNIEKLQYEDKEWIISNEKEEFKLKNGKVLVPNLKRASFEVVEQIFNTSKSFLKNKVFDLSVDNLSMKGLTLNDNTLCVDNKKIYNINVATDFFESISKLKQVTSNGTEKINIEEDVFSQLKRYLDEAKNIEHTDVKISVPITIKGKIGTGKTTFLNLFYYYLLQSIKSNFDYIPLYIDVYEASKEQNFKKLLENIKYWSSFNKKFYVILDGLDEKCVICNDYSKIRSLLTFMKSKAVLFCINEHSNTRREKVPNFISNNKNSEYILYFNGKSKIPNYLQEFYSLENNADYNNVIDLYFDMLNIPQNEDTKENVKKFISECNLPYIDYFILHYITKEALNCSGLQYTLVEFLDKVISDYLMNKKEFGSNDGESALELSYNYVYSTDILDSYLDFRAENLKSQFLIDYYIAKYLAEIIQNGNLADTAFQRYYSKSINYFLVELINNGTIDRKKFLKNFEENIQRLDSKAKSQLLFLKRFITDSSKFYDEQILEKENCQDIDDLIYQRTYWLTTIHQSSKRTKHNRVYKYLKKLISDSEFAKTNREFNLFYYNDCKSINDGFGNTKINDYNFDFKKTFENSFYIIFKDSKKCRLENGNFCIDLDSEYQDKIDINVFTITNILQQRMMFFNDIKISGNKMRLIESILFLMIFLEKYTSQYFRETIEEKAVYTYYKMIINDFYNFLEVNVSLVPLCQEKFTKIEKIETVYSLYDKNLFDALDISRILRVGWKKIVI